MKPEFVAIDLRPGESFRVEEVRTRGGSSLFNYHMGCQITLVIKGFGERWLGDHVENYREGDLAMMGPYLPHMWREATLTTAHHAIVVNFSEDFLGEEFLARPECDSVRKLFSRARRGLLVRGAVRTKADAYMRRLAHESGMERLLTLLSLLRLLAESDPRAVREMASPGYVQLVTEHDSDRLTQVFRHIDRHLERTLGRGELARLTGMSEGSFSRFFSARVDRSLPAYVNEVRIGRACRLLSETERSITVIARECGFATSANFNRRFLELKGSTPSRWRSRLRAQASGSVSR